jgi:hypothetical protein
MAERKIKAIRFHVDGLECYRIFLDGVPVGYVRRNDKRRWGVRGIDPEEKDFVYDFDTRQQAIQALKSET